MWVQDQAQVLLYCTIWRFSRKIPKETKTLEVAYLQDWIILYLTNWLNLNIQVRHYQQHQGSVLYTEWYRLYQEDQLGGFWWYQGDITCTYIRKYQSSLGNLILKE